MSYKSEVSEHCGAILWDLRGPILTYGTNHSYWYVPMTCADEFIKTMEDALENIKKLKEKMENEKDGN